MKKFLSTLTMSAIVSLSTPIILDSTANATDWATILRGVKLIEGSNIIDDNKYHKGKLYNAIIEFQFQNGNGDNRFSSDEKVRLKVIGYDGSIFDTGDYLTKDELSAWADGRAEGLLKAIYTSDPLQTTSGQSTAVTTAQQITDMILETASDIDIDRYKEIRTKVDNRFKKAVKRIEKRKEDDGKKKTKELLVKTYTSEVKLDSERGKVWNYDYKGDSTGSRFDWNKEFWEGKTLGLIVLYRSVDINDEWDSKTKTISLLPYFKYEIPLNDKWDLTSIAFIQLGAVYLKSKIFPDGAGYLDLGGGVSLVPQYKITEKLRLKLLGGYTFSKKYIPESEVPDDLKFVATAINRLEPIQVLTTSAGLNYKITTNWFADASVSYVRIFKAEDLPSGRRKANYYIFRTYYTYKKFTFGLGYKLVRNVSDYKEDAYMATLSYKW